MYEIFEKLLEEQGITAYRVAKDTGISTATLTQWKNGTSTPKIDKLQKIADYLGVTIDILMGFNKYIVEDIEPEYIKVVREAKNNGYAADDIRTALKMLDVVRKN